MLRRPQGFLFDQTARTRAGDRQSMLMTVLDHRVKNNLATVPSIVTRSDFDPGGLTCSIELPPDTAPDPESQP